MLTDTTKQENPFRRKTRISETTRPIKTTKYLRDFAKHLPHAFYHTTYMDISWMDLQVTWANGFQALANVTKSPVSDLAGGLDSFSDLRKTLEKAKCLRFLVIRPSGFLRASYIVHLSICCFFSIPYGNRYMYLKFHIFLMWYQTNLVQSSKHKTILYINIYTCFFTKKGV